MSRYKERTTGELTPVAATNTDYTMNLNDIGTGDTFTVTLTRVGDAVAATTAAISWNASAATIATDTQAAIRALTGFGSSTCTNDSGQLYSTILLGSVANGTDYTLTVNPTGFTPGSHTKEVAGSSTKQVTLSIGRFAAVKRIRLAGWIDDSLDVRIRDNGGATGYKTVFDKTAIDTNNAGADAPYDEFLTADGVAGEDGAAAANVSSGVFEGPLEVLVTSSGPSHTGAVTVFAAMQGGRTNYMLRKSGLMTGATATVSLGAPFANVKRIYLKASADTTVAPTITDAYGKNIYTKSSTNYTTAVDEQLSHQGVDQAANAVADLLDVVVKSPASISLTGLDSGNFEVWFYVEG